MCVRVGKVKIFMFGFRSSPSNVVKNSHDTSFWCDSWLESERVINDRLNRLASLATNQYEIVEQILNMSIWLMEGNKHVSMRKEDNMECVKLLSSVSLLENVKDTWSWNHKT